MQYIPLNQLIHLQPEPASHAAFIISRDKSTFIRVIENNSDFDNGFWAIPTALCGDAAHQYNPYFVMSILSVTPFDDRVETLQKIELPKVLFTTQSDIRRSMTLNAMRMSTELFDAGSERVFELAKNRLEANQTDVVHDLLVYLMHAILDARREYMQEKILRAESLAAYLGISPAKVLSLLNEDENGTTKLAEALEQGDAGILQRKLNVGALVNNQLELLNPYWHNAIEKETSLRKAIGEVLELWKRH